MRAASWAALPVLLATGCAAVRPAEPVERALYRDLERLVTLTDSAGWDIDRLEAESLLPDALMSLCRVEPEQRLRLLDWVDLRLAELGGPVELAYRERGQDLDQVEELLELSRIRLVLARALAAQDECPFWLPLEPDFKGEQLADDRFQLVLAGGGKGNLVLRDGRVDISFGGAGRLLVGRAFGERWAAYTGVEAGAVASFPRGENGRGALVLGLDLVVPAVVRYRLVNAYLEVELGYLAHGTEERVQPDSGVHLGLAVGLLASKRLWFIPGVALAASYERTFPPDGETPLHALKVGARVSFDINL